MTSNRRHTLPAPLSTTLALSLGVLSATSAWAKDEPGKQGEQQAQQQHGEQAQQSQEQTAEKQAAPRELRLFELQHRNPAEIQQLLGVHGQSRLERGVVTAGRAARPAELDEAPPAAIAGAADSRVLFVRGTAEQIQKIEGLVKAVDLAMDQLKAHTIGDKHIIPIQGGATQSVQTTLAQLQLPHQVVPMGDGAVVVISDDGSGEFQKLTEQTQQVIAALQKAEEQKQADAAAKQQQQDQAAKQQQKQGADKK